MPEAGLTQVVSHMLPQVQQSPAYIRRYMKITCFYRPGGYLWPGWGMLKTWWIFTNIFSGLPAPGELRKQLKTLRNYWFLSSDLFLTVDWPPWREAFPSDMQSPDQLPGAPGDCSVQTAVSHPALCADTQPAITGVRSDLWKQNSAFLPSLLIHAR